MDGPLSEPLTRGQGTASASTANLCAKDACRGRGRSESGRTSPFRSGVRTQCSESVTMGDNVLVAFEMLIANTDNHESAGPPSSSDLRHGLGSERQCCPRSLSDGG